jgi:avidin family protein
MINLVGIWYNELGSSIVIDKQMDGIFTGLYESAVGAAKGFYKVVGKYDTDLDQSFAIGWVVIWNNENGSSDAVTSWSGQIQVIEGKETIGTTWLLCQETAGDNNWRSTKIGKDVFTRLKPEPEEIIVSINKGALMSNPN